MKKLIMLSTCAAMLSTSLFAFDVQTSGFINVVGGINDLDDNQTDIINGYDNKYDFQNDSLAALQFNAKIDDKMGAVVQLIAQNKDTGDNIHMEWGYVYYDATDELRFLAGRVRPALFLYSNYLDVGYAYSWITPPSEVYYQAQITNLDGINAAYTLELDDSAISLNVYGGNSSGGKINPNGGALMEFSYDSIYGAELAWSDDYVKVRVGYTGAKVTNNTDVFTGTPVPAAAIPYLEFNESDASFYGAGISVDYADVLFAAEYIGRDMDETVAPDVQAYYAMIGYKIGDFTPTYTYAVADSSMEFLNTGNPSDAAVNNARAGQLDDRTSHTVALRYELNDSAALKFEVKHETVTTSEYEGSTTLTETDNDVNTYRVALNVVF